MPKILYDSAVEQTCFICQDAIHPDERQVLVGIQGWWPMVIQGVAMQPLLMTYHAECMESYVLA